VIGRQASDSDGYLLNADGISKHYEGVTALDGVGLQVLPARSTHCSAATAPGNPH
jgi:ABC-type sugar transport system ATPase subunit